MFSRLRKLIAAKEIQVLEDIILNLQLTISEKDYILNKQLDHNLLLTELLNQINEQIIENNNLVDNLKTKIIKLMGE